MAKNVTKGIIFRLDKKAYLLYNNIVRLYLCRAYAYARGVLRVACDRTKGIQKIKNKEYAKRNFACTRRNL